MLAKSLVAKQHEVLWWGSTFDHARKKYWFGEPRTVEIMSGLKIRLLHGPGYGHNKSPKRFWHNRALANAFFEEARDHDIPDLIFSSLPTLELAERAVSFGKRLNLPVLVDVRDLWPDLYLTLVPKALAPLLKIALFPEFRRCRRLLRNATGVVAISNAYLQWALNNAHRTRRESDGVFWMGYNQQIDSSQETLIVERMRELSDEYHFSAGELVLTFVGSFTPSFNMETLIKAAHIIEGQEIQNIKFVFIGDGDMGSRWRNQAQEVRNIVFTGWYDQVSILAMLRLSNVGIAPYDNALISLPNKPFEYMAASLPLLSSLQGELEELIHNEQIGLQYQTGDVDSLVEKILWFAANPDARRMMGQRARKLFEGQFSADVIYPRLVKHLEKVVNYGNKCY